MGLQASMREKWQHAGFQRYFKNTGWMLLGRVFSLVLSFFVSVYMARSLGPEEYGTLNFVISFVGIAGSSLFVIDSVLLRKINRVPERANEILGTASLIRVISAVVSIASSTILSFFFANSSSTTILVFTFSTLAIFQACNPIETYFQANVRARNVTSVSMTTNIVSTILRVAILYFDLGITYLLLSYVFDQFMSAIGFAFLYTRYIGKISDWRIDRTIFKDFIYASWPFTLSAFATMIYMRVDQIFLKLLLGSEALGIYIVSVRFSEIWLLIPNVLCASILPAMLNAHKVSDELFLARSKKLYSILFYLSLAICAFMFIFTPLIINTLYGPQYAMSIDVLRISVWSIVGAFLSIAVQNVLIAKERFKTILFLNLSGMVVSVALNWLLVPLLGIKGSAVAMIFAYAIPTIIVFCSGNMRDHRSSLVSAIVHPLART